MTIQSQETLFFQKKKTKNELKAKMNKKHTYTQNLLLC